MEAGACCETWRRLGGSSSPDRKLLVLFLRRSAPSRILSRTSAASAAKATLERDFDLPASVQPLLSSLACRLK